LCRDSSDIEIFLIGTAALANLTFLEKEACDCLNKYGSVQVLIENYYLKNYNSIFVKDQVKLFSNVFKLWHLEPKYILATLHEIQKISISLSGTPNIRR
jgi:hypothetical protein